MVVVIKEQRKKQGFTQKKMARILDISERQYQRIDREISLPRKETLEKIFEILDINEEQQKNYIYEMWKKGKKSE